VVVVELDAAEARVGVEVRAVGVWRFVPREWELSSDRDIERLAEWLGGLAYKERTILKLALVGQVSLAQKARLDSLLDDHADLFAALESWEHRSDLAVLPDGADVDDLGLSGFAAEALDDLRGLATGDDEGRAVVAQDALVLLHRLARHNG